MDEITLESVKRFVKAGNIKLRATQSSICLPMLIRIYDKIILGVKFYPIKVNDDDMIIDGHHRYIASLLANIKIERCPCPGTCATMVIDWNEVDIDEKDWEDLSENDVLD